MRPCVTLRNVCVMNRTPPQSTLLLVSEAADRLKLTAQTVRNLILAGELAAINVGGTGNQTRYRIAEADLARFIEARRTVAA